MSSFLPGRAQQQHLSSALCTHLAANARRLAEPRYRRHAIGRRFVALTEETATYRQTLPLFAD